MRRHAATFLMAFAAAIAVIGSDPPPVSAECPYLPPWPDITKAIPTAREIVVGEIVTDFTAADLHLRADQGPRDYALRITHVLRGGARPGDLIDMQYVQANWPQVRISNTGGPISSCTYLRAAPGEVIALAFDALQPGGPMKNGKYEWIQPPTRYKAAGVIKGPGGNYGTHHYREPVTLRQLQHLASLPPTDSADPAPAAPTGRGTSMLLIAGLLGLGFGLRRFHAARSLP